MGRLLDHDNLEVYQKTHEFITWTLPLLDAIVSTNASVRHELENRMMSKNKKRGPGPGKY
ncbi:MAG TPA: hypothetical protein VJ719_09435 [Chthoniobacterales bacterium]|nr:hypothetical protein [Chthoniobacterales bacterium]